VITGHSLGAGAAAILTLLMRNQYPDLVCYGFGMPGSVLDETSCEGELTFPLRGTKPYVNHIIYTFRVETYGIFDYIG
jgi:hypothetical protein